MAEELAEVGICLNDIGEAVKSVKSLAKKTYDMVSVVEVTDRQALNLEEIKLSDDLQGLQMKLQHLQESARNLHNSAVKLKDAFATCLTKIVDFDQFFETKVSRQPISKELAKDICSKLVEIHDITSQFLEAKEEFDNRMSKTQELATELEGNLDEESDRLDGQIRHDLITARFKAGFHLLAGVGLLALCFFRRESTFVEAAASHFDTAKNDYEKAEDKVKEMRQLSLDIRNIVRKIGFIARNLRGANSKADEIKMDEAMITKFQIGLQLFSIFSENKAFAEKSQLLLSEKDAKLKEKDAELNAKDVELRIKDAELKEKDAELKELREMFQKRLQKG